MVAPVIESPVAGNRIDRVDNSESETAAPDVLAHNCLMAIFTCASLPAVLQSYGMYRHVQSVDYAQRLLRDHLQRAMQQHVMKTGLPFQNSFELVGIQMSSLHDEYFHVVIKRADGCNRLWVVETTEGSNRSAYESDDVANLRITFQNMFTSFNVVGVTTVKDPNDPVPYGPKDIWV